MVWFGGLDHIPIWRQKELESTHNSRIQTKWGTRARGRDKQTKNTLGKLREQREVDEDTDPNT